MKTRIKKISLLLVLLAGTVAKSFATGYPVFDVSGWLTAIDQLYQQYDMVTNAITQVENQYRMIQNAVERAKSIDWENIRFDGDFDIRNDIRDANRRINSLLNQARNIQNTLTSSSISCGNQKYSLADLCGQGADGKNILTAFNDMKCYMTDSMDFAVRAMEGELTEKQKMFIWQKYGISPKNYIFVQQSVGYVQKQAAAALAKVTDDALELEREEKIARTNTIINAAYSQTDSEGNMTQGAANEAQLLLSSEIVNSLMEVEESINHAASLSASQMINQENEKQAEADELLSQQQKANAMEKRVPDYFRR